MIYSANLDGPLIDHQLAFPQRSGLNSRDQKTAAMVNPGMSRNAKWVMVKPGIPDAVSLEKSGDRKYKGWSHEG